jgi:hypothetical protein
MSERLRFLAKYGSAADIDKVIRLGDSVDVAVSMKNPHFTPEHHQKVMKSVHMHKATYSPHVTREDLCAMLNSRDEEAAFSSMHHAKLTREDFLHAAMHHSSVRIKSAAVRKMHSRFGDLTPDELHHISAGNPSPDIPMHIWNSVLPKSHPPITHNDIVKAHGGTLK